MALAYALMPWFPQQFCDDNGVALANGSLYTYQPGTTTTQVTYSDTAGTQNSNPITLDAAGRATVFLDTSLGYKFVLKKSDGTTVRTLDNAYTPTTQNNAVCQGRLTLTSGTPVTTADVSAAATAYWTPYKGNQIGLYDGTSQWNVRTFTEIGLSLAGLTASTPYDVFAYDNSGTVTLETLAWTNSTTRATNLTLQNGVLVKSGATTRRYLGTIYINATGGQTDDTVLKRYVWNYYNRVPRRFRALESTGSWTYTTATFRQANANPANQLDAMVGWAEVTLEATIYASSSNSSANVPRAVAIGEDSTTTPLANQLHMLSFSSLSTASVELPHLATIRHAPAVGRHFYAWLETSSATGTTTWYGTTAGGSANQQAGIVGSVEG